MVRVLAFYMDAISSVNFHSDCIDLDAHAWSETMIALWSDRPDPEPVSPAPSIEMEFSVASGSCGLCRGGSTPFCVVGGLSPWTWVSPWLILDSNSVRICLIWIRGDRRHAGIWIEYRLCPNRARRHPQASLDMNPATGLSPVGCGSLWMQAARWYLPLWLHQLSVLFRME